MRRLAPRVMLMDKGKDNLIVLGTLVLYVLITPLVIIAKLLRMR